MSIRLIIADFEPVIRAGLFSFFLNTDIQIVEEATNAELLFQKIGQYEPDVVLMDTDFPDGNGFQLVERIRENGYQGRIIFFSASDRQTSFARALAVGADSYLLKRVSRTELIRTIRSIVVNNDKSYSGELRRVANALKLRTFIEPQNPLTPREIQVLRHVAYGLSNKEIASSLKLSIDTIKEHIQNILRKLDVNDRTQAAVWAVRNNIIQ
ncbi:MAG: response regulator transcription factor [Planctomycetia bacterium]|nr:response regulator transcription factor [Planctomycetia bacterium]